MSLETISNELFSAFNEHTAQARVVLLHSTSRYRPVLLSRLLTAPDLKVYYYGMGPDDVDTFAFLSGFTHDMAAQVPTFGNNVNQLGFNSGDDQEALAVALAADLDTLQSEPFLLILDEFDQADIADDLQDFIERLVDVMPPQCKLVISGRQLPRLPWVSMIAEGNAVILRDAELVTQDFYHLPAGGTVRVSVTGMGPGHVVLDDKLVDTWEGHLPRLLFFFCLDRPIVTRSEICTAFWPDLDTDQAVNVFHVTKRRLHKALEALEIDIMIHEGGYYRLNPAMGINYDIFEFVTALIKARASTPETRLKRWQHALELYQGPFLQGHTEDWIVKRRDEYLSGYLEALSNVARIRIEDGRPEQALSLLTKALQENATRQDLHRDVMRLYVELGRRSEAAGHYQKLKQQLSERGIGMEPATKEVYQEIMKA